jgi:hypothetical protein
MPAVWAAPTVGNADVCVAAAIAAADRPPVVVAAAASAVGAAVLPAPEGSVVHVIIRRVHW